MAALRRAWPYLAHVPVVLLLFSGVLLEGGVPFFRDLLAQYLPDYAFVARAAQQGVSWPLWNPLAHAGAPFLMAYPVDLLSVRLLGPLNALRLDAPLHVLIGMCGASLVARLRGCGSAGAWATGLFYGLSGFVLSSTNPMQLLHAAAWAPWVIAGVLRVLAAADARGIALLALALALQLSTLAAELVLQTALACLFLLPRRPTRKEIAGWLAAAALAAALAAPVLYGAGWLLEGTRRALGFDPAETLAWSASPLVLFESVFPHLFGNARTFSELAYWGKPFFADGLPYFTSLYLGPGVLLLAALAGRARGARALWLLAVLGLLLSLGANGPLAQVELLFLKHFRYPIKFFFLVNLALCLLAGQGVDRCARDERRRGPAWCFVPALALLAAALALVLEPELPARLLGGLVPELLGPAARFVARDLWPAELVRAGALCLAAAFALRLPSRPAVLVAAIVAADLMAANFALNPSARPDFYELRPALSAIVERAVADGPFRWFALSLDATPGVRFAPLAVRANSDVVAYRVARQSLLGRSSALDGLESALETEDSFAPLGATLPRELRRRERFPEFFPELRLANVRWIVSLGELPEEFVKLVSPVVLPELVEPLRVYEVRQPLARAFWTPRCEVLAEPTELERRVRGGDFDPGRAVLLEAPPPARACGGEAQPGPASVVFEQPDPHFVRLRVESPPGFVVVIEGYHRDWQAVGRDGPVPLLRADGRYWALPTAGGPQSFEIRFRPRWPAPALTLTALGLLVAALALSPLRRR